MAEKPRGDGDRDGREAAISPGTDAWNPRKPEEAGRTLPWILRWGWGVRGRGQPH